MKTRLLIIIIMLLGMQGMAQQTTFLTGSKSRLEPLRLGIATKKTTNLIFPFSIKSVDRGSAEVLVQKAKGVENVLQLKAAKDSFAETNLTIITSDGSMYSFLLSYSEQPTSLNLELSGKPMGYEPLAIFAAAKDNQEKILTGAEYLSGKHATMPGPSAGNSDMRIGLLGMYIREGILYFQLEVANNGNIPYDLDQLRFYIVDQKRSKRTASQELEQIPVFIHGNTTVVHSRSKHRIVIALEKFTIPDKKQLVVQMTEKNGGRNLSFKIGNRQIRGSKPF